MVKQPEYCMIETSWECNLSCSYCPRYTCGYEMGKRPTMTMDQIKHILDSIPSLTTVNIAGMHEPLFNPLFFDIAKEIADRNLDMVMTSNCSLWTLNNIQKLPSNLRLQVHMSIDSPIPELYQKCRGIPLSKIYENLDNIKRYKPDIGITIQPLFLKETIQNMDKIIPIARKYNARLSPIYPICFNKQMEYDLAPFELSNFEKLVNHFYQLAEHFGVFTYPKPVYPTPKECPEPLVGPTISVKGEIFPCCYVYEARSYDMTPKTWKEYYNGKEITVPQNDYIMGNIFTDDISKVWSSDNYRKLREKTRSCRMFEKAHPYNKTQYCMARSNKNTIDNKFSYCETCLWRWNQAC